MSTARFDMADTSRPTSVTLSAKRFVCSAEPLTVIEISVAAASCWVTEAEIVVEIAVIAPMVSATAELSETTRRD